MQPECHWFKFFRKQGLININIFVIIVSSARRDVRAGRRSMIGNHVYGNRRTRGSNPLLSAKGKTPYGVFFLFCDKERRGFEGER